jgi:hypothetical protein
MSDRIRKIYATANYDKCSEGKEQSSIRKKNGRADLGSGVLSEAVIPEVG